MGKKILLADDSITIQKVIELTFSDVDFDVVTVGNGRLATERAEELAPDVVLCDIIMPEKDGYEVCEFIKKSATLSNVPVLLLTGAFEPFDQERAARVGADGFLATVLHIQRHKTLEVVNIINIDVFQIIDPRLHVARNGDIDQEKRSAPSPSEGGAYVLHGQHELR